MRAFLLMASALAAPAQSQETPRPPTYFYLLETTVSGADVGPWAQAVHQAAAAHAEHDSGNHWTAYRSLTGGPETRVRFFFPFDKLAELDGWMSTQRVLIDTLGQDKGRAVIRDLDRDGGSSDRILHFSMELSRAEATPRPPANLWIARVKIAKGKILEYAALAKRIKRAHDLHGEGRRWLTYTNAVGGDSSELLYLYPFDKFVEVDGWPSRQEVLKAAYGEREAGRLAAAIEAITEITTSLWQLEPSLSQPDID